MLQVFLCPKNQPLFTPETTRLHSWFSALARSGLISCDDLPRALHSLSTAQSSFAPSTGVIRLFNQDAIDSLLPVELTFESLSICHAPEPELLPLELDDRAAFCPSCEDQIPDRELETALSQLNFLSLDQAVAFCESCQSERMLKKLVFEPPSHFARFWILFDQIGSTRLNPVILRDWSTLLGCPLHMVVAQSEASWEELTQASPSDTYLLPDYLGRDQYRSHRYERKQRGKRRRR